MKNNALKRIQEMTPYIPPQFGRRIYRGVCLDFNERTTTPSIKVKKAIQNLLDSDTLQLYPEYGKLEKKLAKYTKTTANQILITNGSDQAIDLVFRAFTEVRDTVVIPAPSFTMFSQAAQVIGNTVLSP